MLSINTNLSSLIAQNSLTTSTDLLNQAIERMSTGCKINHAGDNAANYSISTNMSTKLSSFEVAQDNVAAGMDLVSVASDNLELINQKLSRLRDLQEQAMNGTYGKDSLNAINKECNALVDEIQRMEGCCEYNGIDLMKGTLISTEESKFIKEIDRRDTSNMTALSSIDPTEEIISGTYSISTAEELAQLATMTNNGLVGVGTEFVLANDIDLSAYSNWTPIGLEIKDSEEVVHDECKFRGVFDGNGYVVSNLKINNSTDKYVGLFGCGSQAFFKNVGVIDANVVGTSSQCKAGILCGYVGNFSNCYTTGYVEGYDSGGITGTAQNIDSCYSSANVKGKFAGGLVRYNYNVSNSYFDGSVQSTANFAGGISASGPSGYNIVNCAVLSTSIAGGTSHGIFAGSISPKGIKDCSYNEAITSTTKYVGTRENAEFADCNITTNGGVLPESLKNDAKIYNYNKDVSLQVGINSDSSCQIGLTLGIDLCGVEVLRNIGKNSTTNYLSTIDNLISRVSEKQTELGAVQNRLESAAESIEVSIENLTKSRSTLRDADIAKESSEYIKAQILQQASATLLATANQAPSIALQLI